MATITGTSSDPNKAGVVADNSGNGAALWASANPQGRAVVGVSKTGVGLWGQVNQGRAVVGAVDTDGTGLWGETQTGRAVVGACDQTGAGIWGEVRTGGQGVVGNAPTGDGVVGTGRRGVVGESETYQGVYGHSGDNSGVVGVSERMHAIFAETHSATSAGLYAHNTAGGNAAWLDGAVSISGDLTVTGDVLLAGADYAERMPAGPGVGPGQCVIIDAGGALEPCRAPYDPRVAGVVSGAGAYRPAIVLDRDCDGVPVALMGKVAVWADADYGPITAGDLLTTSARPGHAMAVRDRSVALGAVIGKALTALPSGTGLVTMLVCSR